MDRLVEQLERSEAERAKLAAMYAKLEDAAQWIVNQNNMGTGGHVSECALDSLTAALRESREMRDHAPAVSTTTDDPRVLRIRAEEAERQLRELRETLHRFVDAFRVLSRAVGVEP